jgi:hypothetical protein
MVKWPWTRRRNRYPEEGAPEPVDPSVFQSADLDLEEQIVATNNVMAIRDATSVFLYIIREHREDGHDCPPYCIPGQMAYFLQNMDDDDLRGMLIVVLKDMVETYLRQTESRE